MDSDRLGRQRVHDHSKVQDTPVGAFHSAPARSCVSLTAAADSLAVVAPGLERHRGTLGFRYRPPKLSWLSVSGNSLTGLAPSFTVATHDYEIVGNDHSPAMVIPNPRGW